MDSKTTYGLPPFRRSILIALAGIVTLFAQCAAAATYYVATNGSDSNPGTSAAPFLTVQRGASAAVAGDTVIVQNGTYGNNGAVTGGDSSSNEASAVILQNSGTASAPITFQAATPGGAILDCQMLCDSYINLYNASYIVIQGFVITHGYKEGIHSNDSAHHITLRGNVIDYIANRSSSSTLGLGGMYTNPNCHDFIIDRNLFHDIGRTDSNWLDHALYLHGANFTVTNNIFYNIPHGWSIQMADGLSNILVANNTFAFQNGDGQPGQIMMWNGQTGVTIENNIFYQPVSSAITTYTSTVSNCNISNNLIYGASGVLSGANGCSIGTNVIGGNPNFVNASSAPYNFAAQAGGAGIDAGVNLAAVPVDFNGLSRPQGASADIGAYEYSGSSAAPPAVVISGVSASGISTSSATITWTTNQAATSYVEYGLSSGYSAATPTNSAMVTTHSVTLTGLNASTVYHFAVGSAGTSGSAVVSSDNAFTTAAPAPVVISGVSVSGVTNNSATVKWSTSQAATSFVDYGPSSSYSGATPTNSTMVTTHSVTLSGLTASTVYHFAAGSAGTSGGAVLSSDNTLTTAAAPPPAISISLGAASSSLSLVQGNPATDTVTASLVSGSAVAVSFSASSLPAGVTASFSAGSCTVNCSTVLSLSAASTAALGTFNIVVTGAGSVSASTTIALTITAASVLTPDITSGLAAQWKFTEGNGSSAVDVSGNNNTATLYNPTWWTSNHGMTAWFSGTNSYGAVAERPSLEMTSQLTVAVWVRPSVNANTDPRVISKLYDWDVKLNGSNRNPQFDAGGFYAQMNYTLPLTTWNHVAFTFAGGVVTGYVNGVQVPMVANTFPGNGSLANNAYGLFLAAESSALANPYIGSLDDVRIYNRALTPAQIAAVYAALP